MPIEFVKVYRNKKTGQFIYYSFSPENQKKRSLRLLRRKLEGWGLRWNYFFSFTYNNDFLRSAKSKDIVLLINRIKQFIRDKIKRYKKMFKKNPKKTYLIERIQLLEKNLKNFKYAWKVEFDSQGEREYNPHFHLLISCYFTLSYKKIYEWWGKGRCDFQIIKNNKMAITYIQKYFKKKSFGHWIGKKWGHSSNLPKIKSNWVYYSTMTSIYAQKLKELTSEGFSLEMVGEIADIMIKDLALKTYLANLQIEYFIKYRKNQKKKIYLNNSYG